MTTRERADAWAAMVLEECPRGGLFFGDAFDGCAIPSPARALHLEASETQERSPRNDVANVPSADRT